MAKRVSKRAPAAKAKPKPARTPDPHKQRAFLNSFAETGSITYASRAARIHRTQHYRWMKVSREYAAEFLELRTIAGEMLEDEAVERAKKGIFEPNVFQGKFVYPQEEYVIKEAVIGPRGAIREPEVRAWRDKPGARPFGVWRKSDQLLLALLRAWLPHRYRPQLELSGPEGGPLEIVERLQAGRERARRMALEDKERDAAGS